MTRPAPGAGRRQHGRPTGSRRRWFGATITVRAVLATCLVALVSVAITAAVALPIAVRAANEQARVALADRARVAANAIEGRNSPGGAAREDARAARVVATLREQGVLTVLIIDGTPDHAGLPARVVNQVAAGQSVSQRVLYQGHLMLAEGRPASDRDGLVLLQQVAGATSVGVISRLWLALVAGLLSGLLAGFLLARRLGRPLREVAAAARRLHAGDRGARAPTNAPPEVADVSRALNDLAGALATSENRQRAFLMSVSHELRTPLTTIKGYAEALADGVVGADGAQRAGQTMLAESEHLGRLVDDLLTLARLEADDFALEVVQVELVSLVNAVIESWGGRAAARGVPLRAELPAGPVYVRTDPGRVRQVVDGLLENALRVLPAGAPLVLAVRGPGEPGPDDDEATLAFPVAGRAPADLYGRSEPADNTVRTGQSAPRGSGWPYAVLEVRDGGPGFTDEDLAVVFERGALHERYKGSRNVGTGMGLALAARLVYRLGGTIEAGHSPEGGARFTVRLPQ